MLSTTQNLKHRKSQHSQENASWSWKQIDHDFAHKLLYPKRQAGAPQPTRKRRRLIMYVKYLNDYGEDEIQNLCLRLRNPVIVGQIYQNSIGSFFHTVK